MFTRGFCRAVDSVAEIASIQASQFFQAEFSFNIAIEANIQDGAPSRDRVQLPYFSWILYGLW